MCTGGRAGVGEGPERKEPGADVQGGAGGAAAGVERACKSGSKRQRKEISCDWIRHQRDGFRLRMHVFPRG